MTGVQTCALPIFPLFRTLSFATGRAPTLASSRLRDCFLLSPFLSSLNLDSLRIASDLSSLTRRRRCLAVFAGYASPARPPPPPCELGKRSIDRGIHPFGTSIWFADPPQNLFCVLATVDPVFLVVFASPRVGCMQDRRARFLELEL